MQCNHSRSVLPEIGLKRTNRESGAGVFFGIYEDAIEHADALEC